MRRRSSLRGTGSPIRALGAVGIVSDVSGVRHYVRLQCTEDPSLWIDALPASHTPKVLRLVFCDAGQTPVGEAHGPRLGAGFRKRGCGPVRSIRSNVNKRMAGGQWRSLRRGDEAGELLDRRKTPTLSTTGDVEEAPVACFEPLGRLSKRRSLPDEAC